MILGGLAGGRLADRMGRKPAVAVTGCIMVLVVAALAFAGSWTLPPRWFLGLYTALYFSIGLFTASSYALFMDLTRPALAATQFSTYMAATNGCEAWTVWAAGLLIAQWGYSVAFGALCVVSLAGLLLLRWLRVDGIVIR
jgi:predicted MFS family arabinose efflux permease